MSVVPLLVVSINAPMETIDLRAERSRCLDNGAVKEELITAGLNRQSDVNMFS